MKKTIIFCTLMLLLTAATANPVGRERSELVAHNAVAYLCAIHNGTEAKQPVVLDCLSQDMGFALLHIYNYRCGDEEGFVIISGDDIADPVLAFSFEGNIDLNGTVGADNEGAIANQAFLQQLRDYSNEIAYARETKQAAPAYVARKWQMLENPNMRPKDWYVVDNIPQLLGNMQWGQGNPYNRKCPGGSVTGCVATAFGMIMNYWDYPEHGFGRYSYNGADNPAAYPGWRYGVQSADFEHTYYDWEHMGDYAQINSSDEIIQAVSTLLYQIGVSLSMNYSPSGSGCWSLPEYAMFDTSLHLSPIAHTIGADYRIPRHFGYKYSYSGMRDSIGNDSIWLTMLYNSLAEGKPIYYAGWASADNDAGHSGTSGHGYIIDGFFSDVIDSNYFHINWGWSGSANGFFKIDAMRPSGSDFTKWHGAIIGLEPDTSYHGYDYTGIRLPVTDGATVCGYDGHILVRNAHGRRIAVFDLMGRLVSVCTPHDSEWRLALTPGAYNVRIGANPAKTIIVY